MYGFPNSQYENIPCLGLGNLLETVEKIQYGSKNLYIDEKF